MIHTVEALDGRRAVSLHICGTDIVTQVRSTFDVERGPKEIFPPDFENNVLAGSRRQARHRRRAGGDRGVRGSWK